MAKEKQITYTENDRAIVNALKGAESPMTLAQINEATDFNLVQKHLVAGHLVSAMRKGLIAKAGEVAVEKNGTRKVYTYNFVTADVMNKPDGKPFDYSDKEKEILAAAAKMDGAFTLTALSEMVGHRVVSGSTNGLIKKGNLTRGEQVEVPCKVKSTVATYVFVKDIPAD